METQQLQTEYTDIKSVTHRVEHSILSPTHAVDREKLLEELSKIRERGYAVDDEEIEPGLHCIAAPIFNHKRQPRMAISLSFPYGRIWDLDWEQAVHDVRYYARQISERVGYTEPVS